MPFKSKAQQKYMFAASARGEIPKSTVEEFAHKTPSIKALPEHAAKKKEHKKTAAYNAGVKKALTTLGLLRNE